MHKQNRTGNKWSENFSIGPLSSVSMLRISKSLWLKRSYLATLFCNLHYRNNQNEGYFHKYSLPTVNKWNTRKGNLTAKKHSTWLQLLHGPICSRWWTASIVVLDVIRTQDNYLHTCLNEILSKCECTVHGMRCSKVILNLEAKYWDYTIPKNLRKILDETVWGSKMEHTQAGTRICRCNLWWMCLLQTQTPYASAVAHHGWPLPNWTYNSGAQSLKMKNKKTKWLSNICLLDPFFFFFFANSPVEPGKYMQ